MKLNYIIIPLITVLVSFAGSSFAAEGMKKWYQSLKKPGFVPKNSTFEQAWVAIFTLAMIAMLIVWNNHKLEENDPILTLIVGTALLNAVLNIFWNYLFFSIHEITLSFFCSCALSLTVLALIIYIYPISILAALLLLPYLFWSSFAAYLNYSIRQLNA